MRSSFLGLFLAVAAIGACGDDTSTSGGGGSGNAGGQGAGGGDGGAGGEGGTGGTPPSCDVHATEGTASFTDTTEAWGLTGVAGGRVMSGDVNGDGFPDL